MIENRDGYIEVDQFINEMKKRNLSLDDLILLYEQYERYNSSARRIVESELYGRREGYDFSNATK